MAAPYSSSCCSCRATPAAVALASPSRQRLLRGALSTRAAAPRRRTRADTPAERHPLGSAAPARERTARGRATAQGCCARRSSGRLPGAPVPVRRRLAPSFPDSPQDAFAGLGWRGRGVGWPRAETRSSEAAALAPASRRRRLALPQDRPRRRWRRAAPSRRGRYEAAVAAVLAPQASLSRAWRRPCWRAAAMRVAAIHASRE